MEDIRSKQLEVLGEAKDYCMKVLHSIDTVIPELKGAKKDDTDERKVYRADIEYI